METRPTHRRSAADIKIKPKINPALANDQITGIRRLIEGCGPNKHHQAIVAISACIGDGINDATGIIDVVSRAGLNDQHVRIILAKEAGNNPEVHRWSHDERGRFSLHDQSSAEVPASTG